MHNLHFLLVKADDAADAPSTAEHEILSWGNENNWRRIGGIASEDGSDDIDNHEGGRWPLSFLDDQEAVPKEGTYFSRAIAYLRHSITQPITLNDAPFSTHHDLRSAIACLSDMLRDFDPDTDNSNDLWAIGRNLKHLSELMDSRAALKAGEEIPQFYDWQFDQEGLTEGSKRYLVLLDMHS